MILTRFGVELRAEVNGDRLVGHAAVFNQVADLPQHQEMLARSAFDAVLKRDDTDVRALFNHDPNLLLGRQGAGTLRIGVDSEGLEFEIPNLPNTTAGNDVRELVSRGDLVGASFAFVPDQDEWTSGTQGRQLRTHTSVARLLDVSPVTYPAYDGASVSMRSTQYGPPSRVRSQVIRARARVLLGGSGK